MQELIAEMLSGPMVNLKSANEHVPEIEQKIREAKEKCRASRHSLPFMRLPVILTINIVLNNVDILGYLPTTAGILITISPRATMTGDTLNYRRHLEIIFGQYFQIHEEYTPHNIIRPHTRGDICMGPRGNKQGGFKFMTLGSMKKVVRQIWYEIPMPDTVIAQVNALKHGKPNDIDFLDRKKLPIGYIYIIGVDAG